MNDLPYAEETTQARLRRVLQQLDALQSEARMLVNRVDFEVDERDSTLYALRRLFERVAALALQGHCRATYGLSRSPNV